MQNKFNILIIHPEGNYLTNPTLKSIVDSLISIGCRVDIRLPQFASADSNQQFVNLLPYGALLRKAKTVVYERLSSLLMGYLLVLFEKLLVYERYDMVLGVDRQGIIEAGIYSKVSGCRCAFLSFEIMFEQETSPRYKRLERALSQEAFCWIIQDPERARQLKNQNQLDDKRSLLIPLASKGLGLKSEKRLRDELQILKDKKVAIIIGTLAAFSMAEEIVISTRDWPPDWVLILHERHGNTEGLERNVQGLIDPDRVYFSSEALSSVDDLGFVLSGVDAGIAMYKPTYESKYLGDNLKYLGYASGKISTYLRYGIPIIVNNIGDMSKRAMDERFGVMVNSPEDLPSALLTISEDKEYADRALDFFSTKLDFSIYENEMLKRLFLI